MTPTTDPVRALVARDGQATWQQLHAACSRYAIDQAVARGRILRARRGLYMLPDLSPARAAAAQLGGVLSHLSAAIELGWPVLVPPSVVHVTVPAGDSVRAPAGVAVHRRNLPPGSVTRGATRPLQTVVDCATSLPFAEALAVTDSALRAGDVGVEELLAALDIRRGGGRRRLRRVITHAHDEAANPFESALRAAVITAGVTGFVPQYPVRLRNGTTALVDLGDPDRRIALEADSFAHHASRADLRNDCRRYDELVRAGWLVLRFAWEHVVLDPDWVALVVRQTCALRVGAPAVEAA